MADSVAITVSVLALFVSATTAWLTLFRRGTIKMTQPTVIYFGVDSPRSNTDKTSPKIFLRTLLFSTSKRGRVIESMHVALSRNETHQNFSIWVYGNEKLVRGSGLFVGESGVSANHHFLTHQDGSSFRFIAGNYHIEVFARLLGDRDQTLLFSQSLDITHDLARLLEESGTGLYFDWGPDCARYIPHVESNSLRSDPNAFV